MVCIFTLITIIVAVTAGMTNVGTIILIILTLISLGNMIYHYFKKSNAQKYIDTCYAKAPACKI
jgi:hypothetical protein